MRQRLGMIKAETLLGNVLAYHHQAFAAWRVVVVDGRQVDQIRKRIARSRPRSTTVTLG